MNEYRTLQEICKTVGVSSRAVQGYEKAGLVSPVDRNKYGHLLYGMEEAEKIAKIKFLQEIRFSIKEIMVLIKGSESELKTALSNQLPLLYEEKEKLEEKIAKVEAMIKIK